MKTILFDLDGTIADSLEVGIDIVNEIATKDNLQLIDKARLEEYRGMEFREVAATFRAPKWKSLWYIWKFKREFNERLREVRPFVGVHELFERLKNEGFLIGILTSNSKRNALGFLKLHNLDEFVSFVYSEANIFGKDSAIRKIARREQLKTNALVYVGDEARDVEASKRAGVPVFAVSWGYNSKTLLEKHEPDFMVHSLDELYKAIVIWSKEEGL